MNIFNRFFLFLLLLPAAFYRKMGVSVPQLKAILNTKLLMDDRRPNSIQQAQQHKRKKPIRFATIGMMLYTALLGLFFLVSFSVGSDAATKFTIFFSFYIFLLASVLISDFTSVLIDVRDNMIILPKPVNDTTFLLARLLHIVIHVSKMSLPLTLPGLITVWIMYGAIAVFPLLVLVVAATLFTIFLINAVYILILKITTPEKFKTVISYFQIFFGVFVYASYQLVPRMVDKGLLGNYSVTSNPWIRLVPSFWFARAWEYLHEGLWLSGKGMYLLLSLALPVLSIWAVIRYFAPAFNRKLSMISGSEGGERVAADNGEKKKSKTGAVYSNAIASRITRKGTERMAFLFSWKIMSRSRDFKMKVYPSIGYMAVYLVMIFMRKRTVSLAELATPGSQSGKILLISLIYISCFIMMTAIGQLLFSDKYKAAWIYYITPIETPGQLIAGAVKAAMVKFCLPILAAVSLAAMVIIGPSVLFNLLLGISNVVFTVSTMAYLMNRRLPFTLQPTTTVRGTGLLKSIFAMLLPLMIGSIHYMIFDLKVVVLTSLVLSVMAGWLVIDAVRSRSWQAIRLGEFEG